MRRIVYPFFLCLVLGLSAQDSTNYLPPMDIPLLLSGNFGEMRSNHFHTGIDIKTQGRQGIQLKSIAPGYVSRIKVSPYGYGRAVYIDHPDGRTSVYAHMRSFSDKIESAMREAQYEKKQWALDFYPEPGLLQLEAGETIGLSGNSGSSAGPHLHFEIRDTQTEHPLNPLHFYRGIKDEVPPLIRGIRIYPIGSSSHLEGQADSRSYPSEPRGGEYHVNQKKIKAHGTIGLAIHTYDKMSGTNNKYGIYSLALRVNGQTVYEHKMDELNFDTFQQVNCHKDYHLFHENKWRYHKCFPSDNNDLEIYTTLVDGGKIQIEEEELYSIEFLVKDIEGNSSQLSFNIQGDSLLGKSQPEPQGVKLDALRDNVFVLDDIALRIPRGRLYSSLYIRPERIAREKSEPSDQFLICNQDIPVDDVIYVDLKSRCPDEDKQHLVAQVKDVRGRTEYKKGSLHKGWYQFETKKLGRYTLVLDKKAPTGEIRWDAKRGQVSLRCSDNLSGVDSISIEVDGQWIRAQHNAAMSRAWFHKKELKNGGVKKERLIRVLLRDLAGNESYLERKISF